MNRFDLAIAKGLAAIKAHAGVAVTLTRGSVSVELTAVRGASEEQMDGSQGARLRSFVRDYLIEADDYDFGEGPVHPALGDRITDDGRTYEVGTPSDDKPWRWHDRARSRLRVHTVET